MWVWGWGVEGREEGGQEKYLIIKDKKFIWRKTLKLKKELKSGEGLKNEEERDK